MGLAGANDGRRPLACLHTARIRPKHTHTHILHTHARLLKVSTPTFIAELLSLLARRLPADGRPAVHHVDPPLGLHVLLAPLQRLDEELPVVCADQTCLGDNDSGLGQP